MDNFLFSPLSGLLRRVGLGLYALGGGEYTVQTRETRVSTDEYILQAQWGASLCEFLWMGESMSWSQRAMDKAGICRRPVWERCTNTLAMLGVIVKIPDRPSGWGVRHNGAAWHYPAFRHALRAGEWDLTDYLPRAERDPYPILPAPMFYSAGELTRVARPERVAAELARPDTPLDAATVNQRIIAGGAGVNRNH